MKKISIKKLILFTGLYGIFSVFTFMFITWDGLSVWMGINVGFAMIPWVLIVFLYQRFKDNMDIDLTFILIMGLFIFFYPNAFYILTDFIHVERQLFYIRQMYEGITYLRNIDPYLMLAHIIISALVGTFAGIQSLLYLEEIVKLKYNNKKITNLVSVMILFLSGIGIYIGRFLRFFSWDILRPVKLLTEFFNSLDGFSIAFILWITLLEIILFYGYKFIVNKIENTKQEEVL